MTNLEQLTVSIKEAEKIDPSIERWLMGVKSLQQTLSEKVILLCRYSNTFPDKVLLSYANTLQEVLQNNNLKEKLSISERLNQRISEFLARLDDNGQSEIARSIREAIKEKLDVGI